MVRDPLVAVLVGTDHHPFDRLLSWVSDVARVRGTRWFVQHGSTPLPLGLEGAPMLSAPDLADLLERADAVVTHGGPGLIMEARACGHFPIAAPRDPALNEHVDDHQLRFIDRLARVGLVLPAHNPDQFVRAVDTALAVGRTPVADAAGVEVSQRFGALVAGLVQAR